MTIRIFAGLVSIWLLMLAITQAQQPGAITVDAPTPLTQAAVAFDSDGQRAIEATLRTTSLSGAVDAPVTNIRIVLRNVSKRFYSLVSGHVAFYDGSGVRCGEGLFKADAFAANESVETDTPGIRITCSPATWRIVATSIVPLNPNALSTNSTGLATSAPVNLVISIDNEEHPLQLGKPLILNLGDRQRTVMVRAAP